MKEGANNKTSLPQEHLQTVPTAVPAMPQILESHPPRWEYMEARFNHISELDALGDDGWELVSVAVIPNDQIAYLKRPVSGNGGVTG